MCYPNMPICLPCRPGCGSCRDATPCWVQEAWLLRAGVLALQAIFMVLVFLSMLVAYKHRRSRVSQPASSVAAIAGPRLRERLSAPPQRIRASGLLLLEMILFGSLLLYFPVRF